MPLPESLYSAAVRLWQDSGLTRGITRTSKNHSATYVCYRCPHDPGHPATYPGHPYVAVREDTIMAATASFFTQYVFGPGRATMLQAQLPAGQALRDRIRDRHRELFPERATLNAQRAALETAAPDINDPTLLDALPVLGDILTEASPELTEQLFEAFHLQAV